MKRRESIQRLLLASGSLTILPAWANGWDRKNWQPGSLYSLAEQEILSSVVDTIIPEGNGIGALSVGVDDFLVRLFAECYDSEVQSNVRELLQQIDTGFSEQYGKPFHEGDKTERENFLNELAGSGENSAFVLVKRETIRGFQTSKVVMTEYLNYQVAPGHYTGCVEISSNEPD